MHRSPILDYVRHALALTVILSHSHPLSGNTEPLFVGVTAGTFAVYGFFFLSGSLITQSWQRDPRIVQFWKRRVLRLAPGLCGAIILSFVLAGRFDSFRANPYPAINGSLWTLPCEIFCYALVALVGGRSWLIGVLGVSLMFLGYGVEVPRLMLCFGVGSLVRLSSSRLRFDYSYGMYIYAFPLQQTLVALFGLRSPLMLAASTLARLSLVRIPSVRLATCTLHSSPLCSYRWRSCRTRSPSQSG